MEAGNGREQETQSARLSFRSTARNFAKIVSIAKSRGWINAKGAPNVSAVLNFLVEAFDLSTLSKKDTKKEKSHGR